MKKWNSKLLTREQHNDLAQGYKSMDRTQVTRWLNQKYGLSLTVSQVVTYLKNHKIKSGRNGKFPRNGQPWNKGIKYIAGGNSQRTQFKKGRKPHTWKPVGYIRTTTDGYREIKISDTGITRRDYVGLHRLEWEKHHGPVPKGHVVIFKDGNKQNTHISNLECLSRAELSKLNANAYTQMPDETKPAVLTLSKLQAKAGIKPNLGKTMKEAQA
jgi:hypothetical protein